MEWSLELIVTLVVLMVSLACGSLYYYFILNYNFWKVRGVPYAQPAFPFGNISDLVLGRKDMGRVYNKFYRQFKGRRYGGIFETRNPVLVLTDLDLIKQIVIKDFNHFTDRALPPKFDHDFLMTNLFFMNKSDGWKDMRAKLTPTFTSGKMKLMYTLIERCSEQLKDYLRPLASKEETFDVKDVMSRFTLDIIGTCAFGLDVNNLTNADNEFYKVSQLIFTQSRTFFLRRLFIMAFTRLANFIKMTLVDPKVSHFMLNLVEATVKYREENGVKRNDFLDLLIEVKHNRLLDQTSDKKSDATRTESLTMKQMAAQAFIFFAAGFETAASTTTFILYELACHPEVQEKLRQEVDEITEKHNGHVSYQALQEMTYMDQVMNETLRMHGSVPNLIRKCVEPYTIPGTELRLEKGMKVLIPLYGIHHDPDIYPEPEVFDPERFTEEKMKGRHNCSFLPFGEGPRMCIGMRFGKMQVKAGLATILSNFELSVTPDTLIPVEISPRIVITTPVHPIRLKITSRKQQ